eukprot:TRINITY_DN9589_c0_g2_i1.p2 TRINITY_DN9589_c0_g2~~TRINITY_DN9589_c0_g2_i1.p2  ORF type:complete len:113 (+),score=14.80 TRINITY_DN9589_c0_g2_i1:39-341(+)
MTDGAGMVSTIIDCGYMCTETGERVYKLYSEFFEAEIDVFYAECDSTKTPLFRASLLTKTLGFSNNKIGMYLHRNRGLVPGAYSATSYKNKSPTAGGRSR